MRSAGCTINDIADHEFLTSTLSAYGPPITSGELEVKEAALVGAVLALIRPGPGARPPRWEAVAWSVPAVLFTILYPYTSAFCHATGVLGITLTSGIVIAFCCGGGRGRRTAWLLWLANIDGAGVRHRVRHG